MSSLYELMMAGDEPSAMEKAQAMAKLLSRQQAVGQLAQLTGDKVLSPFGQGQMQAAQRGQAALGEAGQVRGDRILRRDMQAGQQDFTAGESKLKRQFDASEGAKDRGAANYRAGVIADGQRADARAFQRQKEVDANVEALSKRQEQAPALVNDLRTLVGFIQGGQGLPGVGTVAGHLPDLLVSDDGVRLRQAARGVAASYLKERSGTAASEKEVERLLSELGMGSGASEDQFRIGTTRLLTNVHDVMRSKEAGYSPEVLDVARSRGMKTSSDLPQMGGPNVVEERQAPDGRIIQLLSDGTKRVKSG